MRVARIAFSGRLSVSKLFGSACSPTASIGATTAATTTTTFTGLCSVECGQFGALPFVVHDTGTLLTENCPGTGRVVTREEALSIAGVVGVGATEKVPIVVAHFFAGLTRGDTAARLHNVSVGRVGVGGAHVGTGRVGADALVLQVVDFDAAGAVVQTWVCSSVLR